MLRRALLLLACLLVASVALAAAAERVPTPGALTPATMVKEVFAATCPKACGATCTIMFHRCNVACNRRCSGGGIGSITCMNQCGSDCGTTNNNCVRSCQAGLKVAAATLSELAKEEDKEEDANEEQMPLAATQAAERSLAASNFAAMHAALTSQVDAPSVEPCKDPTWSTTCRNRIPACKNACRCGGGVDGIMRCNKCQVACDEDYDACIYCGMGVEFCCSGGVLCDDGWNTVAAKLA